MAFLIHLYAKTMNNIGNNEDFFENNKMIVVCRCKQSLLADLLFKTLF